MITFIYLAIFPVIFIVFGWMIWFLIMGDDSEGDI